MMLTVNFGGGMAPGRRPRLPCSWRSLTSRDLPGGQARTEKRSQIESMRDPDGGMGRMRLLWKLQLALVAIVVLRLFAIQILGHGRYTRMSRSQYSAAYKLPAVRGNIYDRAARPLALSQEGAAIYIVPRYMFSDRKNGWTKFRTVCSLVGRSPSEVWAECSSRRFVWLKKAASPAELERVREAARRMRIAGVGWEPLCIRHYPEGMLASHVLGYTNNDGKGLAGIEFMYDKYLRRDPEDLPVLRDNRGRLIFTSGGPVDEARTDSSLSLTIDTSIQHVAERELEESLRKLGARWGCAVVLDVGTGEVLALANAPRFHPSHYGGTPLARQVNHAVSTTFEPGSTFKLVALAAALQEHQAKEDTVFDCERGAYLLGDEVIHDVKPHGRLTLAEMIAFSSNIGFAKVGLQLGHDRLFTWARRFGFGESTRMGLPGEEKGLVRKSTDAFSLAAMAFGQGVGVTAMQLAVAYAALANDGVMMRPYIIKEARDYRGSVRLQGRPKALRRVVSSEVARSMGTLLEGVVRYGTGQSAAIPGYRVAGKTGTAQVSDSKGYLPDSHKIVTFVGYLPADQPRILVLVAIDRPGYGSGGGVAGPVFREIAIAAVRQAGVPATAPGAVAFVRGDAAR